MISSDQASNHQSSFCDEPISCTFPKTPFEDNNDLQEYLRADFINEETVQTYGIENCQACFDNMMEQLCRPPLFTCVRVNSLKISSSKAERMLTDYFSQSDTSSTFVVNQHPVIQDALLIRSSLPSHNTVPSDKVVVVSLACGIAVLRGSHIYAPGVMSMRPGIERGDRVSVIIDIEGKCLRGALKSFHGKKLYIGDGYCKISRKELFTTPDLKGIAVLMTHAVFISPSLGNVLPELIFLQNLPSVVCCHVLGPQPGEWVLDMCAAPGGKTTHLAALMKNQGIVIAIDKTKPKVEKIKENASRWGTSCVKAFVFDSMKICAPNISVDYTRKTEGLGHPPYGPNMFDKILLDTPCSALGQRPQLCNKMTLKQLKSYKSLQRKLFSQAVALLKVGGSLVYSTCSLTLEENEGLVFWALATFPCLQLAEQEPHIGAFGRLGAGLTNEQLAKLQRFGFNERSDSAAVITKNLQGGSEVEVVRDTIGFFIAKFIKPI